MSRTQKGAPKNPAPVATHADTKMDTLHGPSGVETVGSSLRDSELRAAALAFGAAVKAAGGVFVEPRADQVVPPLPSLLTLELLKKNHPYRRGTVGQHALLGLADGNRPGEERWVMLDRGNGGATDVVPKSRGRTFDQQKQLLERDGESIAVAGVKIVPAKSHFQTDQVIGDAFQANSGRSEAPFFGVLARTGYLNRFGESRLVGFSLHHGSSTGMILKADAKDQSVGLAAEYDLEP